jgi:pimeloyl-ACP methyl ester carboxylesterase
MTAGLMRKLAALLLSMLMTSVWAGAAAKSEKVATIDGERIAYEVRGKGNLAIVLVHGWSCDRSYFQHQLESFSDRYTVVTLDLAGHGESTLGRENYTIALFGADVAAVVRKLDLKRVVLVGHSMGGDVVVAAGAAAQGPGRGPYLGGRLQGSGGAELRRGNRSLRRAVPCGFSGHGQQGGAQPVPPRR